MKFVRHVMSPSHTVGFQFDRVNREAGRGGFARSALASNL
jgi:hypothetical protein